MEKYFWLRCEGAGAEPTVSPGLEARRRRSSHLDQRAPVPPRGRRGEGLRGAGRGPVSLGACCSPSTPPPRSSPSPSTTASDVVVELRSDARMKHGEQLAPLHRRGAATRRGVVAAGPHRDRGRGRPGPVHRPAGRPGHRAHAGASCSRSRCTACARSTCSPREAVDDGRGRRAVRWSRPTRAARRSTGRRTTGRARASTGPHVDRPADVATDRPVVGEGALLYPDAFPHAVGPAAPERRLAGPRGRPRSAPSCSTRSRSTSGVPTRSRPASPSPSRDPSGGPADDVAGGRRPGGSTTSARTPGRSSSVAAGVTGELPTVTYLVAEVDGTVVGHAAASVVADIAELQRIAVDAAHRRTGLATALLEGVLSLAAPAAPTGCCSRSARTTPARLRVLRGRRLHRDRPAPPLLPRRRHRRRAAAGPLRQLTGPEAKVCTTE